jgi:hypothetical protein
LILGDLRKEIDRQCSKEDLPKEYSFLKNVGRALTRVKHRQENDIKVKSYLSTQVRIYIYSDAIVYLF